MTPDSIMVGTSGASAGRFAEATARMRSLPALCCGSAVDISVTSPLTTPDSVSGTSVAPDFHVTYYVLVTVGSSSQQMGQFLQTNAQWGIPLWSPNTSAMTFYPQGTMVIDAASMATGNLVWRGIAEAKVEMQNSEAERSKRLREVIRDLVTKFPKKAS